MDQFLARLAVFLTTSVVLGLGFVDEARADSAPAFLTYTPVDLPDQPAPPSIADLTHRQWWFSTEFTFASTQPQRTEPSDPLPPRSFIGITRLTAERSIVGRTWYVGGAAEAAYGNPPGPVGGQVVFGYPEVWIRGIFATKAGLAYGGGIGAVAPLFLRKPESEGAQVAEQVRVVRPWDFVHFDDNKYTFRPFLDARVVDHKVQIQVRQGFDVQVQVAASRLPEPSIVSRTTLHVGYAPIPMLAMGVEGWEVYFVSAGTLPSGKSFPDDLRAVFAISPYVRFMTDHIQPTLSAIFPFDRPLFNTVQSYWALRLGIDVLVY